MTEREINGAFAEFDPQHPFYLAVLALLDNSIATEQDAVTIPGLTDAARHFNAGRLAHAKDLRAIIPDQTRAAILERVKRDQRASQ
jgi:hypothetical protein